MSTKNRRVPLLLAAVLLLAAAFVRRCDAIFGQKCEIMKNLYCKSLHYNLTAFPNTLNDPDWKSANKRLSNFRLLLDTNCHKNLKEFLCVLIFPVCYYPHSQSRTAGDLAGGAPSEPTRGGGGVASGIEAAGESLGGGGGPGGGSSKFQLLKPCRSFCRAVERKCTRVMANHQYKWSDAINCNLYEEREPCMKRGTTQTDSKSASSTSPNSGDASGSAGDANSGESSGSSSSSGGVAQPFQCPARLRVPAKFEFRVRLSENFSLANCGLSCNSRTFFYSARQRRFARFWVGLWSALCLLSTLFTVATFLIDTGRFQYPERPIVFLSVCYLMISLTYVAGFALQDRFTCTGPFVASSPPASPPAGETAAKSIASSAASPAISAILASARKQLEMLTPQRLVIQGTKFEGCIILFMFLYFFSMASAIWWVVLTITWYLAAKCHWAHESIAHNSQYFHFAAWALPAAKTIGILAFSQVDGDPLTGVCYTGLHDNTTLQAFLITPLAVYLLVGGGFLLAGFVSLLQIRALVRLTQQQTQQQRQSQQQQNAMQMTQHPAGNGRGAVTSCLESEMGGAHHKLDKLITRIGIFGVLYVVPALVVIGCLCAESSRRADWMRHWYLTEVCPPPPPTSATTDDATAAAAALIRRLSAAPSGDATSAAAAAFAKRHTRELRALANEEAVCVQSRKLLLSANEKAANESGGGPVFELAMIKYLMTLVVGMTSGVWVWSGKTLLSWRYFLLRLCGRLGSNAPWTRSAAQSLAKRKPITAQQPIAAAHLLHAAQQPITTAQQQPLLLDNNNLPIPVVPSSAAPPLPTNDMVTAVTS